MDAKKMCSNSIGSYECLDCIPGYTAQNDSCIGQSTITLAIRSCANMYSTSLKEISRKRFLQYTLSF